MRDFMIDADIKIKIAVEVNGELVYEDYAISLEDLESNYIRKAAFAINQALAEQYGTEMERTAEGRIDV